MEGWMGKSSIFFLGDSRLPHHEYGMVFVWASKFGDFPNKRCSSSVLLINMCFRGFPLWFWYTGWTRAMGLTQIDSILFSGLCLDTVIDGSAELMWIHNLWLRLSGQPFGGGGQYRWESVLCRLGRSQIHQWIEDDWITEISTFQTSVDSVDRIFLIIWTPWATPYQQVKSNSAKTCSQPWNHQVILD